MRLRRTGKRGNKVRSRNTRRRQTLRRRTLRRKKRQSRGKLRGGSNKEDKKNIIIDINKINDPIYNPTEFVK